MPAPPHHGAAQATQNIYISILYAQVSNVEAWAKIMKSQQLTDNDFLPVDDIYAGGQFAHTACLDVDSIY